MIESVHCPTCATHYGLKAARVRAGHKRALCFRCASVFNIEEEVARLLAPHPAPRWAPVPEPSLEPKVESELSPDMGIGPSDFADLLPTETVAEPLTLEPIVAAETPLEATTPSLTLGDLEGAEEEILEKTLMVHDSTEPSSPASEPEPVDAEEDSSDGSGNYRSAKDAIARLLGGVAAPEPPQERRSLGRGASQMDVEATLDALESTLSGVSTKAPEPPPASLPPEFTQDELTPAKPSASTMKLTSEEIQSALKDHAPTVPAPAAKPVPSPAQAASASEPEMNLLKVQVGQETYNNISMEQITQWIEQGRVQDFHMVARQFSENWIEAGKVPTLRPVFDRLRRQQAPSAQQSQAVILPPQGDTAPAKKSLFGGLFNRG